MPDHESLPEIVAKGIEDLMDGLGLSRDLSVSTIKEAHHADKIVADDMGSAIVPDHKIRLDAAKLALELRGYLNKWRVEVGIMDEFIKEILAEIGNVSPEIRDRIIQKLKEAAVSK